MYICASVVLFLLLLFLLAFPQSGIWRRVCTFPQSGIWCRRRLILLVSSRFPSSFFSPLSLCFSFFRRWPAFADGSHSEHFDCTVLLCNLWARRLFHGFAFCKIPPALFCVIPDGRCRRKMIAVCSVASHSLMVSVVFLAIVPLGFFFLFYCAQLLIAVDFTLHPLLCRRCSLYFLVRSWLLPFTPLGGCLPERQCLCCITSCPVLIPHPPQWPPPSLHPVVPSPWPH